MAQDKKRCPNNIFLISRQKHVVGTHQKRLTDEHLQNVFIEKYEKYHSFSVAKQQLIWSYETNAKTCVITYMK